MFCSPASAEHSQCVELGSDFSRYKGKARHALLTLGNLDHRLGSDHANWCGRRFEHARA